MLLIYKQQTTEKGEVYNNYYLKLENGYLIPIKPSFKEDYPKLRLVAIRED